MATILPPTAAALARAAALLREGEVVGFPTETVYGLAGNALDPRALARIFSVKERPSFDPLIVHVPAPASMASLEAEGIVAPGWSHTPGGAVADGLARRFWPGPLTLVLPRGPRIPDLATSGLDTVGVRAPAHPVARALLEAAGIPLAAPSANRFGRISPTAATHVEAELGDRIPLVLDGGETPMGIESTVLLVNPEGRVTLLRPGALPLEAVEEALGERVSRAGSSPRQDPGGHQETGMPPGDAAPSAPAGSASSPEPASPGMLASHYSPGKPLLLLPDLLVRLSPEALGAAVAGIRRKGPFGLLLQSGTAEALDLARERVERALAGPAFPETGGARPDSASGDNAVPEVVCLSPKGSPEEAARRLFAALRALDGSPRTRALLAEPAEGDRGLFHAINDRLRRAAIPPEPGANRAAPGEAGFPPGTSEGAS
ncbi:MAG: threonylcarbamoyl-AMP synthase [Gemmatimonadales bacterium]|nr:MAG: threonylcarbamoyl-AMP synthase [Gemmatimonadales bacterium]